MYLFQEQKYISIFVLLREALVLVAFTAVRAVTWLLHSLMTIHIQVLGGQGTGKKISGNLLSSTKRTVPCMSEIVTLLQGYKFNPAWSL